MEITLTLSEILNKCNDWDKFCDDKGISPWAVNEGFGSSDINLSEEDAKKYGIIKMD